MMSQATWNDLLQFGTPSILLCMLIYVISDPLRADLVKSWLISPFFKLFRWGSRQYMASTVSYTANHFFNKHVFSLIPSIQRCKLVIKWVTTPSDPVFLEEGKLILCLQETPDQTRNTLSATRVALPQLVCPTVRQHMHDAVETAMDLVLLRRLAEGLGRHARPIFQRYFYSPEVAGNSEVEALFGELVELDEYGVFVAIFLEELTLLGDTIYSRGDTTDQSDQIRELLNFLLTLARRRVGEEVELSLLERDIRIGVVLCAKRKKALERGIQPYIVAAKHHIRNGCDTIYLVAFPGAEQILERTIRIMDGESTIEVRSRNAVRSKSVAQPEFRGRLHIACLRRIPLFEESDFQEKIQNAGISVGAIVPAVTMDVSKLHVLVDVMGLNGIIKKEECSWNTISDCDEVCNVGDTIKAKVLSVDVPRESLVLSMRLPELDPWKRHVAPNIGDIIRVDVKSDRSTAIVCTYHGGVEIIVSRIELSWTGADNVPDLVDSKGRLEVIIYEKDEVEHKILGSVRRLQKDPWPKIHESLPKGTKLSATVKDVHSNFIQVDLPNGLTGIIPDYEMHRAGHEYATFSESVVRGQGLDVVVTKVFLNKKKIRLGLARVHESKADK